MAPKAAPMGEEQFLAACFRHCIDKPKVDYNNLALAIGMSAGGAANKFRAIMKKFEDEGGASWTENGTPASDDQVVPSTPTAKRKVPAKKVIKAIAATEDDELSSDEDAADTSPPKKKAKTQRKKTPAKVKGKSPKAKTNVDEEEFIVEPRVDAEETSVNGTKDEAPIVV